MKTSKYRICFVQSIPYINSLGRKTIDTTLFMTAHQSLITYKCKQSYKHNNTKSCCKHRFNSGYSVEPLKRLAEFG